RHTHALPDDVDHRLGRAQPADLVPCAPAQRAIQVGSQSSPITFRHWRGSGCWSTKVSWPGSARPAVAACGRLCSTKLAELAERAEPVVCSLWACRRRDRPVTAVGLDAGWTGRRSEERRVGKEGGGRWWRGPGEESE